MYITTPELTIRQVGPDAERASIRRLLSDHLSGAASDERFEAMYLRNPCGHALVWLAETPDGEAVGTSAAFPRLFHISGRELVGLVLSDFAIDSRFRTLGPAISLLKATLEPIENEEYAFALDFPSESMLAVYKRLKWAELGRQSRLVRPLKISPAIRRRYGRPAATLLGKPLDGLLWARDALEHASALFAASVSPVVSSSEFRAVEALRSQCSVFGDRDVDYLAWRYQDGLRFDYKLVSLTSRDELVAYAVVQQGDAGLVVIVEFECPPAGRVQKALMAAVASWARGRGAEGLQASTLPGTAWHSVLKGSGFRPREESTGPVVYSRKDAPWCDLIADSRSWWMTDGDRDG